MVCTSRLMSMLHYRTYHFTAGSGVWPYNKLSANNANDAKKAKLLNVAKQFSHCKTELHRNLQLKTNYIKATLCVIRVIRGLSIFYYFRNIEILSKNRINANARRSAFSEMAWASLAPSGAKIKLLIAIISSAYNCKYPIDNGPDRSFPQPA